MGTYLSRTPGSVGNRQIFTFSCWAKKSKNDDRQTLFSVGNSNNDTDYFHWGSNNKIAAVFRTSGTTNTEVESSSVYRDPTSWYHVVMRVDTTQSTASDRVRLYVNGSEVTYGVTTYPTQNTSLEINETKLTCVGARSRASVEHFMNGFLTGVHFSDGYSYGPSTFGMTDSTTGIWKPKTFAGTYGTNGFKLEFKNAGALGTDTSGNTNTFTVNNAGTNPQVVDTPSNVFPTLDVLANQDVAGGTFSEGNLKFVTAQSDYSYRPSTFGMSAGKWYWEVKATAIGGGTDPFMIGITSTQPTANNKELGNYPNDWAYREDGKYRNNDTNTTWGSTFTAGDIIGVGLDITNNKLFFSKNGTWQESGNPATGANGIAITAVGSTPLGNYFAAVGDYDNASGSNSTFQLNFGNPSFSISSGNADANGYGNFEYAVPSGYYAICTKNINSYG